MCLECLSWGTAAKCNEAACIECRIRDRAYLCAELSSACCLEEEGRLEELRDDFGLKMGFWRVQGCLAEEVQRRPGGSM